MSTLQRCRETNERDTSLCVKKCESRFFYAKKMKRDTSNNHGRWHCNHQPLSLIVYILLYDNNISKLVALEFAVFVNEIYFKKSTHVISNFFYIFSSHSHLLL